ncbi:sulfotransferase family 2 domain-containing protein [Candidatus Thiothrix sp. Deng01]|uniref:Sulfotransferase family 2 domain-containing protein n=1 Tax=Candidatus Thiothrix phosphatis TaxID=3112415 RepID=A0ABU6CWM8_9GAMM|nr:sulfotransferase family 2 domain-containing protein [Candidatus Thiothrix sp. Deng01]MEB4591240.1 sulfotransferase family 2 domain-containing protein [Candidatus Thiothrix sp. Deng01]
MLISHSHRFIFFHIAKTAGISVRKALGPYCEEPERFRIPRPPVSIKGKPNPFYEIWESLLLHATAQDARKELPGDSFGSYFKFAFVRNPWDWQVSMYHFILREETHIRHELVKSMGGFEPFLEWVVATPRPYPKGGLKYQYEAIADGQGELLVDFVGRYESLPQDFQQVCQQIGVEAALPHLNKSSHHDYRTYYNDRTRRMVAEHFETDIALFQYRFGD